MLKKTAHDFPSIAALRVRDALETIEGLVAKLAVAIRAATGVALATSVLVLAGALAANRRARIYDSVVLKILGATRARLLAAFLLEYALLGATTVAFGLAAGAGAAYAIVTRIMQLDFALSWPAALAAAAAALALTVALGLDRRMADIGTEAGGVLAGAVRAGAVGRSGRESRQNRPCGFCTGIDALALARNPAASLPQSRLRADSGATDAIRATSDVS